MSHPPRGHEIQKLQQELADTHKKLQDYADTIVSLHSELRTLRDDICMSCKRKFLVPANLLSSQTAKPASTISSLVKSPQEPAKSSFSWRRLLKAQAFDHIQSSSGPPKPEIPKNISPTWLSVLSTPSKAITEKPLPTVPRWFAERDATANEALDVTFVREFVHKAPVPSVRFSPDGKYLATVVTAIGNKNSVIFIYDVETGNKICELAEYASQYPSIKTPGINFACFSPNGSCLALADEEGWVTVWDIPKKRIRNMFRGHGFRVQSLDFSPNGRLVVSSSLDRTVRIWNTRDGSSKIFTDSSDFIWSVGFNPNGQLVTAGTELRIWDVRTGQLMGRWTRQETTTWSMGIMAKVVMSSGTDGLVKLGRVPVATENLKPEVDPNSVCSVAVSPDSQWIASGLFNTNSVVISDAHDTIRQCTLIGHVAPVASIDFSPVGGYLALGSLDGHVTLWRYK